MQFLFALALTFANAQISLPLSKGMQHLKERSSLEGVDGDADVSYTTFG